MFNGISFISKFSIKLFEISNNCNLFKNFIFSIFLILLKLKFNISKFFKFSKFVIANISFLFKYNSFKFT